MKKLLIRHLISKKGKEQLIQVLNGGLHMINVPASELKDYIYSRSYFEYLKNTLGVDDQGVLRMARHSAIDWGSGGTDTMSIGAAMSCGALGFVPKAVYDDDNPYIYHYPDGNAGIARALVKKLIPSIGKGNTAEELVLSKFDYTELDKSTHPVRIRLNSTVVNVQHGSNPQNSDEIFVNYINDDKSYNVKCNGVVMACYNMIIPHIVSDLPEDQAAALKLQNKSPIQYTTVGLRNWRAMKEMEIGLAMSPGNMHQAVLMDFPVSMGGMKTPRTSQIHVLFRRLAAPMGRLSEHPNSSNFVKLAIVC